MPDSEGYHVIIIGAGLAGAALAHYLAEQDHRVAVLEATASPGGTLKQGPGLALLGTATPSHSSSQALDDSRALDLWKLSYDNLDLLEKALQEAELPSRRVGSRRLAATASEAEAFQQWAEQLKSHGYTITYEETSDALDALLEQGDALRYTGLVSTIDDIQFEPEPLIRFLLDHENITIEPQTEAYKVKPHPDIGLTIWAHDHYLWADKVVAANGIHASRLSQTFAEKLTPVHVHTVLVKGMPTLPSPLILKQGRVVALNAQTEGEGYLVASGPESFDLLRILTPIAEQLCPGARVVDRFSTRVARSGEPIPWIGAEPDRPNLYALVGLGAHGTSWAFVAASRMADLILSGAAPDFNSLDRVPMP